MKWLICVFGLSLTAQIISLEKERALGAVWAEDIRSKAQPLGLPEVVAFVERIGARLAAAVPGGDFRFEVVAAEGTEPIGLPGGFVIVPAAFLAAAEDEAEVAVMIAHAMGHVSLRHGFVNPARAGDAKIPLFFGGMWMGAHVNAQDRQSFVPPAYWGAMRQNELDADRFGVDLAGKAGYDRAALARYVRRVQPEEASAGSPVPPKEERLAALASIEGAGGVVSGSEFLRLRAMVRVKLGLPAERKAPSLGRR